MSTPLMDTNVPNTPQDNEADEKLIIFGWIMTVFGLPENGDPTKYNELTDKLYDLLQTHDQAMMDKLLEGQREYYSPALRVEAVPVDHIRKTYKRG